MLISHNSQACQGEFASCGDKFCAITFSTRDFCSETDLRESAGALSKAVFIISRFPLRVCVSDAGLADVFLWKLLWARGLWLPVK